MSGAKNTAPAAEKTDEQLQDDYEQTVRRIPIDQIPAEILLELNAQTAVLSVIANALVSAVRLMTLPPHERDKFCCNVEDGALHMR